MLKHPYLRALAAFVGSFVCLGGASAFAGLAVQNVKTAPGLCFFAGIAALVFGLLGAFLMVAAVTCAAYGTVRSLRRWDAEREPKRAPAPVLAPTPARWEPVPDQAPIPMDEPAEPAPKHIALVMRDPGGKVARLPLRDPSKRDHYIAKYEARGYTFLRSEPL